jgi:hypothetical protein
VIRTAAAPQLCGVRSSSPLELPTLPALLSLPNRVRCARAGSIMRPSAAALAGGRFVHPEAVCSRAWGVNG